MGQPAPGKDTAKERCLWRYLQLLLYPQKVYLGARSSGGTIAAITRGAIPACASRGVQHGACSKYQRGRFASPDQGSAHRPPRRCDNRGRLTSYTLQLSNSPAAETPMLVRMTTLPACSCCVIAPRCTYRTCPIRPAAAQPQNFWPRGCTARTTKHGCVQSHNLLMAED